MKKGKLWLHFDRKSYYIIFLVSKTKKQGLHFIKPFWLDKFCMSSTFYGERYLHKCIYSKYIYMQVYILCKHIYVRDCTHVRIELLDSNKFCIALLHLNLL